MQNLHYIYSIAFYWPSPHHSHIGSVMYRSMMRKIESLLPPLGIVLQPLLILSFRGV